MLFAISSYVPNLNIVAQTEQTFLRYPLLGSNNFRQFGFMQIIAYQCPTMPFAIPSYLPNFNIIAQTEQKLWPCPLFGSKLSAITKLCKLDAFYNPVLYTSLYKNLERSSSRVRKLWRCPLSRSNSVRNLGLMQLRLFLHNVVRYIKLCAKSEHL